MNKNKISPRVIVDQSIRRKQKQKEIATAKILLSFFKANIRVLPETSIKAADYLIKRQYWELKVLLVKENAIFSTNFKMPGNNPNIL